MKTCLTTSPDEAAAFIKRGGVVAFPTETVYGLGADVFDESAIERIFEAKQRPPDNPLIAHVSDLSEIDLLSAGMTPSAAKIVDRFFPGPLTVVLPKAPSVPLIATAGLETIGIRMPRHPLARAFIGACGRPVVAPSANLSGRPSPTTWRAVAEDLDGRVDCILQGDPTEIGIESTVVDCTGDVPVLLRAGAVSFEELRSVVPDILLANADEVDAPRSPGMRHRHYMPRARVMIVRTGELFQAGGRDAFIGLTSPAEAPAIAMICESVEQYAASLFEFFRECDRKGVETIFCETVEENGIGRALLDRLSRAAAST